MIGEEFSQYRAMVQGILEGVGSGVWGLGEEGSVTIGSPAARLLIKDGVALYPELAEGMRRLAAMGKGRERAMLCDSAGHAREVYHPLVLHLHLAAFLKHYESLPAPLWGACEEALPGAIEPARFVEDFADKAPPPEGVAVVLWDALCLLEEGHLASRDVDVEVVDSAVHALLRRPGPEGALHPCGEEDSLDAWTYRELTGLHALANLAIARRNQAWARRVQEVATYHLHNTQPDNTTTEPWALPAFLWSPSTRSFAEQQLHDAQTQKMGPVGAMLLADAANTLSEFVEKKGPGE
jgi:hypothetical protein